MAAVTKVQRELDQIRTLVPAVYADSLFLTLAVGVSFVLHAGRLGFYSDDWVFLELLTRSEDPSVWGLARALALGDIVIRQRPIQILYLAGLYRVFGLDPLGYHLANLGLMTAGALLFYLGLRALRLPRLLAVCLPLVYGLLPHYSTDRFWLAAHQANISMAFYFLSLYADLRAQPDGKAFLGPWKLISLASMAVSGLAYEVALPLFLLNPFLVWLAGRQRPGVAAMPAERQPQQWISVASHFVVLALVVVYKAFTTVRLGATAGLLDTLSGVALGALRVNFGIYGVGLPYVVWWILRHEAQWPVVGLSLGAGLALYAYLIRLPAQDFPGRRLWQALTGLGVVVFGLGYAVFVANTDIWFTSASLGNRVAIAGAVGVAMVFVGLLGWASGWVLPRAWRRQSFCLGVAALGATGLLINNTLAAHWVTAYQQQQLILDELEAPVQSLPAHSNLVLDGVCLEQGGAYAFTGHRDLASALRLRTGDTTLSATALTNPPDLQANGLALLTYGEPTFYSYGQNLFVYNYTEKELLPLPDAERAHLYFEGRAVAPERDCPPGFAWGLNTD